MFDVRGHRGLRAAVLAMKAADRGLRSDINKATRATLNPVWRGLVAERLHGRGRMEARVLGSGVRIAAGNPPTAKAAQSTRMLGHGTILPTRDYAWWEFGTSGRERYATYERKNRKTSGKHTVRRRASRAIPRRDQSGRVVYPAFAELAPRAVSLWVQLIVRKYNEAAERMEG